MDTINTIITNAQVIAHAHIDWSPTAGPIWLVGTAVVWFVMATVWTTLGIRAERRQARSTLYRQAERVGHLRDRVRVGAGYQETV